jgi:hypothetical protein
MVVVNIKLLKMTRVVTQLKIPIGNTDSKSSIPLSVETSLQTPSNEKLSRIQRMLSDSAQQTNQQIYTPKSTEDNIFTLNCDKVIKHSL